MSQDVTSLARRFFGAVEKGDLATVAELYHPEARIWHNTDLRVKTREENLAMLRWVAEHIRDFHYEDQRIVPTEDGFVATQVCRGRQEDGRPLELHTAVLCEVRQGRITRLDEYFDSARAPGVAVAEAADA